MCYINNVFKRRATVTSATCSSGSIRRADWLLTDQSARSISLSLSLSLREVLCLSSLNLSAQNTNDNKKEKKKMYLMDGFMGNKFSGARGTVLNDCVLVLLILVLV